MKKAYFSPMTQTLIITAERFIAFSQITKSADGKSAEVDLSHTEYNDEFAVKSRTYSVWDDNWAAD